MNMNSKTFIITDDTQMYVYIYHIHIYIHIIGKIKLSINVHVCMHACIDMYGKIRNKQGIESNMYTTWDASLQVLCDRIPWGT